MVHSENASGCPIFELQLIQAMVDAALSKQFLVCAGFAELALVQDEDAVHVLDRRETMSDRNGRTPSHEDAQGVANQQLRFGVDARGRFVEDEHARIERERSGE
jgi:hypothetical protein